MICTASFYAFVSFKKPREATMKHVYSSKVMHLIVLIALHTTKLCR